LHRGAHQGGAGSALGSSSAHHRPPPCRPTLTRRPPSLQRRPTAPSAGRKGHPHLRHVRAPPPLMFPMSDYPAPLLQAPCAVNRHGRQRGTRRDAGAVQTGVGSGTRGGSQAPARSLPFLPPPAQGTGLQPPPSTQSRGGGGRNRER
jgi:hypothetical protein